MNMAGLILTILLIPAIYPVVLRARAVVAMFEFRGASLAGVVRAAVRGDRQAKPYDLQSKKLPKGRNFYPFGQKVAAGSVLFVGEGNFSFALSLARLRAVEPGGLTATSYEPEESLSETAYDNAQKLIRLGARVRTGVDGTRLADTFPQKHFRLIIFQFPNVASREALYSQNPNHVMITRFLKSASDHLARNGEIVVSTVDSPFYEGAFKMQEAAQKAGLARPVIYDFDPARFAGYAHQNTDNEGSALGNHDTFATFAFSRPTP